MNKEEKKKVISILAICIIGAIIVLFIPYLFRLF